MTTEVSTTEQKLDVVNLPEHMKTVLRLTTNDQDLSVKSRVFYIVDGKVIFGILLLETQDSFLVGMPARMIRKDPSSDIEIDQMYDGAIIRIIKSSVAIVAEVPSKFKFLLMDYIHTYGAELLPEYLTEDRLTLLSANREIIGTSILPMNTTEMGPKSILFPGSVSIH